MDANGGAHLMSFEVVVQRSHINLILVIVHHGCCFSFHLWVSGHRGVTFWRIVDVQDLAVRIQVTFENTGYPSDLIKRSNTCCIKAKTSELGHFVLQCECSFTPATFSRRISTERYGSGQCGSLVCLFPLVHTAVPLSPFLLTWQRYGPVWRISWCHTTQHNTVYWLGDRETSNITSIIALEWCNFMDLGLTPHAQ